MSNPIPSTLTPAEQAQVAAWLKAKGCACGSCGSARWGEPNGGFLHFSSGLSVKHHVQYPAIMVICQNCGHMHLFSPEIMGVSF